MRQWPTSCPTLIAGVDIDSDIRTRLRCSVNETGWVKGLLPVFVGRAWPAHGSKPAGASALSGSRRRAGGNADKRKYLLRRGPPLVGHIPAPGTETTDGRSRHRDEPECTPREESGESTASVCAKSPPHRLPPSHCQGATRRHTDTVPLRH